MGIKTLDKPPGVWCRHCKAKNGCSIYQTRPDECRDYNCWWLENPELGPDWRPEKSKIVINRLENSLRLRCDPGFPQAWRKEPYYSMILGWAKDAQTVQGSVVVVAANEETTLIGAEGEFALGPIGNEDKIRTLYLGDQLMSVEVVKPDGTEIKKGDMLPHLAPRRLG
jgi:hypothetical protein